MIMPGMNGTVTQVDDELGPLAEYWHLVKTKCGEKKEPGSNLGSSSGANKQRSET